MHAQPSTRRPRLNERLRLWLERGRSGFHLRDAATGDPVRWEDPRILVVPVAGVSFRIESLDDPSFANAVPARLSGTTWSVALPTPALGTHTLYAQATQGFDTGAAATRSFTVTK